MKKVISLASAIVMVFTLCSCSTAKTESKITQLSDLEGKNIGIRTFTDGFDAETMKQAFIQASGGVKIASIEACESGTDSAILSLQSGKISALITASFEADYYTKMNDKYSAVDLPGYPSEQVAFMGVAKDQTETYELLNSALAELKTNGTLATLTEKYITNLTKETQAEAITIPTTDGAKTIKVALTGSAMPLDYFDASGKPAGFDAALLAEIAKLKKVNFEISTYEPNGGLAAVNSGKADVYFCLSSEKTVYETGTGKSSLEELYNIKATDYYFESAGMKLLVNK